MGAKTKTPTSLAESLEIIEAQQEEIVLLNQKYTNLLEQFKLSRQRQFGRKSESHVDQLQLFDEAEAHTDAEPNDSSDTTETITYKRKKPTRKPLPKDLPREQVIHDVDESEKQCDCGCEKQRIGEEISEQLEVIPASVKVIQHVRPKYACNRCDSGVSIATMPTLFLPKSIASPSLVAHIIVNKYQDHLPLYRQEKIWQRAQVDIPRNTMCGWIVKAYEKCLPLKDLLIRDLLSSDYLQVDETTLQVMSEPGKKNTSNSYMWMYRSALPDKKINYFEYRHSREGKWPESLLANFKGYLQTDGYAGYDWVSERDDITHLGCMAHARRPFAELVKIAKKTGKSHQAIAYIKKLYAIEKEAKVKGLNPEARYDLRMEKSKPILDELFKWIEKSLKTAVPSSKLGIALNYMYERKDELCHYLLDGRLEIDNNDAENQIRPFAVGRKNWLFSGSPRGADASCFFYTLISTAIDNGLNPFDYLNHIFNNIAYCKSDEDYTRLLPYICEL